MTHTLREGDFVALKFIAKQKGVPRWVFPTTAALATDHFWYPGLQKYKIVNGTVIEINNITLKHAGIYMMKYSVHQCERTYPLTIIVIPNFFRSKFVDKGLLYLFVYTSSADLEIGTTVCRSLIHSILTREQLYEIMTTL